MKCLFQRRQVRKVKAYIGLLVLILSLSLFSSNALAVDIRGRIQIEIPYAPGWAPRPYANVVLITFNQLGQAMQVGAYVTGPDGMYYFLGVPPGFYRLTVNNIIFIDINVPNFPSFDVNPIFIPN